MKNVVVFGASTSTTSINQRLAAFAATLLQQTKAEVIELNSFYPCPMFSTQSEAEIGFPEAAGRFRDALYRADGFIVSLAEHNGSYSAAFKNLFDWVSRKGDVWNQKPVLLLGTSPGERGASFVLEAARSRFPFNGASEVLGPYSLPKFQENFVDGKGISDAEKLQGLLDLIHRFEEKVA